MTKTKTKTRKTATSQKKSVGFSLKLSPGELEFVESARAKIDVSSAEVIRGFINSFRYWFDLPPYMAAELRRQMEERGLNERQYFSELLAREYERTIHGGGGSQMRHSGMP